MRSAALTETPGRAASLTRLPKSSSGSWRRVQAAERYSDAGLLPGVSAADRARRAEAIAPLVTGGAGRVAGG